MTDNYEVGMRKSEPEYFQSVAKRLGAEASECWVFEDALYAMKGARLAGMKVCAIAEYTMRHAWEDIIEFADMHIEDYREFLKEQDF